MAAMGYSIPKVEHGPVLRAFAGAAALVSASLTGDAVARWFALPLPGSIVGLVLLAAVLMARPAAVSAMPAATTLLRALPLLFVPLVVQAVAHAGRLGAALGPALCVIAVSTAAAAIAAFSAARCVTWISSRSR